MIDPVLLDRDLAHLTQGGPPGPRRGHVPVGPQPTGQPRQGGGGSPLPPNVNNRLFAPLAGLDPNNILQGGYDWLSKTDNGATYHPGLDLNAGGSCNADDGLTTVAVLAGVVRAVLWWNGSTPGEGNHLWYEIEDPCSPGPTYVHHDHMKSIAVAVGQPVEPGEFLGTCGRTGGWDCAHLHTELCRGAPAYGYWQWPYGWSRGQVEGAYWNPYDWWERATASVIAEGGDVPAMQLMNDWQVKNWVLNDLYQWAGIPYNPESGSAQGWVAALRENKYLGRPRTEERPYGEGGDAGVWVEYDYGVLWVRARDNQASWTG
jgi:hypothetical protein